MKLNMTNHRLLVCTGAILLALMFLLMRTPTVGAQQDTELSRPAVNRTVPEHTPPVVGWSLPASPSAQEIRNVRLFVEPLVPVGAAPSAEDNRALAKAIQRHDRRAVTDDFSDLEQFLANHPGSPESVPSG